MSQHVSQAEFARIEGVHRSTVNRWIKSGRISVEADGKIDTAKARRQRNATESPLPHHQARKAQIDNDKARSVQAEPRTDQNSPQSAPASTLEGVESIGAALKFETYKLQKAKAEAANLEIDKLAGALVERSDVDYVLADFGNTLRTLLEGLPDRLAPALASHRGNVTAIHAELEGVAADVLEELADLMQRRMSELAA